MTNTTEVVKRYGIGGEIIEGPHAAHREEDNWDHYAMEVRLQYRTPTGELRELVTPWHMGVGHSMAEWSGDADTLPPESVADVVSSLGLDYSYYKDEDGEPMTRTQWEALRESARKFEDWCYSQQMVEDIVHSEH